MPRRGRARRFAAPLVYLALFVPYAVFFPGDGLPGPYWWILGAAILIASPLVGYVVGAPGAMLLPVVPLLLAVVLIYATPEEGEVGRAGASVLYSFLFAVLVLLVGLGVAVRTALGRRG
jgi:hypothetical protein